MASLVQVQSFFNTPMLSDSPFPYRNNNNLQTKYSSNNNRQFKFKYLDQTENGGRMIYNNKGKRIVCNGFLLPVDPWAPNIDSQSIASQLFALSLFPYLGFLYFITKSNSAPRLTLFGFYFLLAFVGATIPAGIYAKVHYGTSLSNVDWLHGGAESLLTLTNLFIVLGLREALRKASLENEKPSNLASGAKENDNSSS